MTSGTLTVGRDAPARRWLTTLLDRSPCSRREGVLAALVYVAVAFMVYGLHVARGGFLLDDWAYLSEYDLYGRDVGFFGFADRLLNDSSALMTAGGRPLGALYFSSVYTAFGSTMALHLAWVVVLAGLVSAMLYVVLRSLRVERLHAAAIAALGLLFPASDSTRFWPAAAVGLVALILYLAGLAVALRGLTTSGGRAIALHACAVTLYALSLLQYEIALGGIVFAGLLYRLVVTSWRPVLLRWAVDAVVVISVLAYLRSTTTRTVSSPSEQLDRLRVLQNQARRLLGQLGVQDGPTVLPVGAIALVLVVGLVLAWRLRPEDPVRPPLRRWLAIALVGAIAIGAGYVVFSGARDEFYKPLREGIGNRTNGAAMIGYVVLLYAIFVVAGLLVARALVRMGVIRSALASGTAIALLCALALGVLWFREVNEHRREWNRGYAIVAQTVSVIREHVSRPPSGSSVYAFGVPGETGTLVPAFTADWDLTGAVRWIFGDGTLLGVPGATILSAYPGNTAANSGIACRLASVRPRGYFWHEEDATPYGKTIFVHVPTRDVRVIRTRAECRRAVADFL